MTFRLFSVVGVLLSRITLHPNIYPGLHQTSSSSSLSKCKPSFISQPLQNSSRGSNYHPNLLSDALNHERPHFLPSCFAHFISPSQLISTHSSPSHISKPIAIIFAINNTIIHLITKPQTSASEPLVRSSAVQGTRSNSDRQNSCYCCRIDHCNGRDVHVWYVGMEEI